jgi:hypothetical protein
MSRDLLPSLDGDIVYMSSPLLLITILDTLSPTHFASVVYMP